MEEDLDNYYSANNSASFKDMVLLHLRKISELGCNEMRGGYYSITIVDGKSKESYVDDNRARFDNAVLILAHLLQYKFDEPMKQRFEFYNKAIIECRNKFIDNSTMQEDEILGEQFYDTKDKILLEQYKHKRNRLHFTLFEELCTFLGRINYLEVMGGSF